MRTFFYAMRLRFRPFHIFFEKYILEQLIYNPLFFEVDLKKNGPFFYLFLSRRY